MLVVKGGMEQRVTQVVQLGQCSTIHPASVSHTYMYSHLKTKTENKRIGLKYKLLAKLLIGA